MASEVFGEPDSVQKTRTGKTELSYNNIFLRFSESGAFLECTFLPGSDVRINGILVSWDIGFLRKLYIKNGGAKNSYGFIVFSNLGVAVTGIHDGDASQMAVTVFNRSELGEFLSGGVDYLV